MKKSLILFLILLLSGFSGFTLFQMIRLTTQMAFRPVYGAQERELSAPAASSVPVSASDIHTEGDYEVYVDGVLHGRFETYEEALTVGEGCERAAIRHIGKSNWLWDNYPPYNVFLDRNTYTEFQTFAQAVAYAKEQPRAYIYYRRDNALAWTNAEELQSAVLIPSVPWISQYPELPRGCEVTSLAMLLNYKGIPVDKLTLADEIKKNDTPYRVVKGVIHGGSPYRGFVGDMKNMSKHGLGVYHDPIYELLTSYLPNSALDLTGAQFEDILYFLNHDTPVWVIVNSRYQKLPSSYFEKWQTEDGELAITYQEHSVLVTGYDDQYIYYNDPLSQAVAKASRSGFIEAWEQMGRQAVTVTP